MKTRILAFQLFVFVSAGCFPQQIPSNQPDLADAVVSVSPGSYLRAIPGDFIGMSQDHNEIAIALGQRSTGIHAAYRNLLKNLTDAGIGPLFLRVEGDVMTPEMELPGVNGGVANLPQSKILVPLKELAEDVNVHYSLGLDMASNHPEWAAEEARRYLAVIPANVIEAFEIGNEPDSYQYQNYRERGAYLIDEYLQDWARYRDAVVAKTGTKVPFMGPSAAGSAYLAGTIQHLGSGFDVAIYSQHAYPYGKSAQNNPDLLLLPGASLKTVGGYQRYAAPIHAKGVKYRIGEMNSVAGGGQAGISDTFQAALWLIDTGFAFAQAGFDGFNFHTGRYTRYNFWDFHASEYKGRVTYDRLIVHPPYYGMLVLSNVMGNGAHLLSVSTAASAHVRVWATVDKAQKIHVVIVNSDEQRGGTVRIAVPGWNHGTASLLKAPAFNSTAGITFAGQTFDGSTDGTIQGAKQTQTVQGSDGKFSVDVPVTSAVLLDLSQ